MGQQQLLLIILVTILAGTATAVAINTFGKAAEKAAAEAVYQDMTAIASAAQGYYVKPKMLGGGSNSFNGINFHRIQVGADSLANAGQTAFTGNGRYILSVEQGGSRLGISGLTADGTVSAAGCVDKGSFSMKACDDSGEPGDNALTESTPDSDSEGQGDQGHSGRKKGWWRFFR